MSNSEKIVVVGLGYVGLPLAAAFAKHFENVTGFDVNLEKVASLQKGIDPSHSVSPDELHGTGLKITSDENEIHGADFYIVAVPTPVDKANNPDLTPVERASETVGRAMRRGAVVCYESTVYPGVTEEICGPILARVSGLPRDGFKLGYSPERINPGDKEHELASIVKVVSGEDAETGERLARLYGTVVKAGIHLAPSIKVAEAAKVIENTQRDLNIALMNELAIIFDMMGINTSDVLAAAGTKWNFLGFKPGLVGGHCIGVDPYYLTYKSEQMGYIPQVILAGRRINDAMGKFVAQKTIKLLCRDGSPIRGARVGVFGLAFKENVPDIRNSKVPNIVTELREFGVDVLVHDPLGDPQEAMREYGIELMDQPAMRELDAVVLAVAHDDYLDKGVSYFNDCLKNRGGVFIDVKSKLPEMGKSEKISYWSL